MPYYCYQGPLFSEIAPAGSSQRRIIMYKGEVTDERKVKCG
jgi:hypothetical protein